MSAEGTECELQQLVSSDEENVPSNNNGNTPQRLNMKSNDSTSKINTLHPVTSEHSYRSSKVRIFFLIAQEMYITLMKIIIF